MGGRAGGSGGRLNRKDGSDFLPPRNQQIWENRVRQDPDYEYGAYFSESGELLIEARGTSEEIEFDNHEMNRNVEQRVWADEIVHATHTHTEDTIFSPEDIDAFERLENKSERAILPNGTTYTLIRNQPRSSSVWILNENTNQLEREFEPKHIAPAYDKEYTRIYEEGIKQIRSQYNRYSAEYNKAVDNLFLKTITPHMENWLKRNASKYGYIFKKGKL